MRLTFCGTRGSTPATGAEFFRYGGHTSCVAISDGDAPPRLILDAGTGIRAATQLVGERPFVGTVLLGHLHWDHTQGLPFFTAAARVGARVRLLIPDQGVDAVEVLARVISPPHFPVTPRQLGPGWTFESLAEGEHRLEGFVVRAREIPHKGGRMFGYRVSGPEAGSPSVAYLSDHSPTSSGPGSDGLGDLHRAALDLAGGVDVLIHDAQHLASEMPTAEHLGHSCVEYAVGLAAAAGVGTLVLFHHSPDRTDDQLDAVLQQARLVARATAPTLRVLAAADGMRMEVPRIEPGGRPTEPARPVSHS